MWSRLRSGWTLAGCVTVLVALTAVPVVVKAVHLPGPSVVWKAVVAVCGVVLIAVKPLLAVPRDQAIERAKRKGRRHEESSEILEALPGWGRRPAKVREVTDRAILNIHESIPLPSDARPDLSRDLPVYVLRDIDSDLRTFLTARARTGGFALLIGPAAAGKTRTASEALRAVLPDWTFLMPDNGSQINTLVDDHTDLTNNVIWLNETQNYLTGSTPLSSAALRRLLASPQPTIVIGTIWRDRYDRLRDATPRATTVTPQTTTASTPAGSTGMTAPDGGTGSPGAEDSERNARDVLSLATTFALNSFSEAEWNRTEALADEDPRLRAVIEHRSDTTAATELLACQPELLDRWHHGTNPYGRAVITAAVTARHCGHPPIIPDTLLRPLAEHLLTGPQRATANPDTWYEQALTWARTPVLAGTEIAPLTPHADTPGTITGHHASDILTDTPHDIPPPALWELITAHTHDLDILLAVGDAADDSDLRDVAQDAWRNAASNGSFPARRRLADHQGNSNPAAAVTTYEVLTVDTVGALGPDHPDTLTTRHNLSYWRGEAGDAIGAVDGFTAVLHDYERVLGPDHTDTLSTRYNLANWRGEAGNPADAVADYTTLLHDRQRILGPDHTDTLTTRHNLAQWRGEAGDASGAVEGFTALLHDHERVLGPDHPDTLTSRQNLAYWRGEAGDASRAVEGFTALLHDRQRIFGPDHPNTLRTRHHLAHWRGEAGNPADAVADYTTLRHDHERVLGPDHPDTLTTRHNLADWRGKAGNAADAVADYTALRHDRQRVLGPDHPDTLSTRHNLANWRGEAGNPADAVADYTTLLHDRQRVLGHDHPNTLTTRHNLAHWRGKAGNPADAVADYTTLLHDCERVLGPDHPHTLITRHELARWQAAE